MSIPLGMRRKALAGLRKLSLFALRRGSRAFLNRDCGCFVSTAAGCTVEQRNRGDDLDMKLWRRFARQYHLTFDGWMYRWAGNRDLSEVTALSVAYEDYRPWLQAAVEKRMRAITRTVKKGK